MGRAIFLGFRVIKSTPIEPGQLQVLWLLSPASLPTIHQHLFNNSISLSAQAQSSQSSWRDLLDQCSPTLKHLKIWFKGVLDGEIIPSLQSPSLELLDVDEEKQVFPRWIEVPKTVKLHSCTVLSGLPPISEVFTSTSNWDRLSNACPTLQVLISTGSRADNNEELLSLLDSRKEAVEAGLEVEGVKMQKLEKLMIRSSGFEPEQIEQLGGWLGK